MLRCQVAETQIGPFLQKVTIFADSKKMTLLLGKSLSSNIISGLALKWYMRTFSKAWHSLLRKTQHRPSHDEMSEQKASATVIARNKHEVVTSRP